MPFLIRYTELPSPPEAVLKATRDFLADRFPRWQVETATDGLEATDAGGSPPSTARFRLRPVPKGTSLVVEYRVGHLERSPSETVDAGPNPMGASEAGGSPSDPPNGLPDHLPHNPIDDWLQEIRLRLYPRRHTGIELPSARRSLRFVKKLLGNAIALLMIVMVLIWFTVFFAVLPAIGLATGDLYIPGKGRPGVDITGPWARIISAGALVFFAFSVRSFLRQFLRFLGRFRASHGRTAVILVWCAVIAIVLLFLLAILGMIFGDNS